MLHALQRQAPAEAVRLATRASRKKDRGRILACAYCRRAITTTAARIEVEGSHEHSFRNPFLLRFRVGCFRTAAGVVAVGEASTEWTWFPPRSWRIEQCRGCREHLGWLFRSAADRFHGLILDRLVEREEDP